VDKKCSDDAGNYGRPGGVLAICKKVEKHAEEGGKGGNKYMPSQSRGRGAGQKKRGDRIGGKSNSTGGGTRCQGSVLRALEEGAFRVRGRKVQAKEREEDRGVVHQSVTCPA